MIYLGTKFEHAIKWRIPTLKPEWIFESSEKGSCLRLTNFLWPTPNFDSNSSNSKGYFFSHSIHRSEEFSLTENEKPLLKDTVDSSTKIMTIDQPRKSTSLLTTEDMTDLEERFDKWMNNRSKKIVDDLFDGLKVRSLNMKEDELIVEFQVFLGQFPSTLRMRMQKILDGGCAVR